MVALVTFRWSTSRAQGWPPVPSMRSSGEIESINAHGTPIIVVEQNARDGLDISDRGYVLDQGMVWFKDDANALLADPQVTELYLGG